MTRNDSETHLSRRNVLKGVTGAATAGALGLGGSGSTTAEPVAGEQVALQYFHEDWETITNDLDRVAEVGFDAIWIQAPQKSRLDYEHPIYDGRGDPPMGYQPIDLRVFDSVLGTEAELQTLIDTAHDHGVEVYVDTVMNHMAAGQDPKYEFPQFRYEDFHHDPDPDEKTRELYGMPDLKQSSEYVRTRLYFYMEKIADTGADGFRYDAAKNMPQWFFSEHANQWADNDFGGMFRVGEVFSTEVEVVQNYADTGMNVFDYPLYFAIEEAFNGGDMRELEGAGLIAQDPFHAMPIVENHDTQNPDQYKLAHAFVLGAEGYPMLYNLYPDTILGDEEFRTMISVKKNHAGGPTIWRHSDEDLAVFEREGNLLVGLNNGSSTHRQWVKTSWSNESLTDQAGNAARVATGPNGWTELALDGSDWTYYTPTGQYSAGIEDGATYVIRNANSGKALDVAGISTDDGADVHQWHYVGGANQHWTAEAVGDGYYRLVATHSGKALTVADSGTDNGANVVQAAYEGGANQQWEIQQTGDGFRFIARHSGAVLEIAGWSAENGGTAQQWNWHANANQRWIVEPV